MGFGTKKEKVKRDRVLTADAIAKKYPGSGLASVISIADEDTLWLPSRCIPLNNVLGGGIPYGRIIEIFGEESSGKTLAALDWAAVTQSLGGEIIYSDAEQSFTPNWAELNGLDPSKVHIYNHTAIEYISDWLADMMLYLRSKLTHNEPILFIEDSLAAVDCLANINSTMVDEKAEMGNRAKAIYKMLRIRNQMIADLGITCIFINQIRKKLGATQWEDPDTTPGGGAMKYFAHQRIGFYNGKQISVGTKDHKKVLGKNVSIRTKKNKVAPPRATIKAQIYFAQGLNNSLGFDRYFGLLDLLIDQGVVERRGSNVYFKDQMIARSEDRFMELIARDTDLRSKLIKRSGINTVSRTRKRMESINGNMYPIKNSKIISQLASPDEDEDDDET